MREEFVIFVALFIGIGGIAVHPDNIVKNSYELNSVEKSDDVKNLEVKGLNETELYREGISEKINVSQRSSVYINQKFRKQLRNQMYKVLVPRVEYIQNYVTDAVPFLNLLKAVTTQKPKNKLFVPNIPNVAHAFPHLQYNYQNGPNYNPPPSPQQLSNQQNSQHNQQPSQQHYQRQNQAKYMNMYNDHSNKMVVIKPTQPELKSASLRKDEHEQISHSKSLPERQEKVHPNSTKPSINSIPNFDSKTISKNKGRITSLTNRKTSNIRCGFPDPHLLHRSSFHNRPPVVIKMGMNKNINKISSIREHSKHLNNKDWPKKYSEVDLENLSGLSEEEDKIDKYIKEALEDKEKNDDINAYIKMIKNSKNDNLRNNTTELKIIDNNNI